MRLTQAQETQLWDWKRVQLDSDTPIDIDSVALRLPQDGDQRLPIYVVGCNKVGDSYSIEICRRAANPCGRSGYYWRCSRPALTSGFCEEHEKVLCSTCEKAIATRECCYGSNYLSCPNPLCDKCACTAVSEWGAHDPSKREAWKPRPNTGSAQ